MQIPLKYREKKTCRFHEKIAEKDKFHKMDTEKNKFHQRSQKEKKNANLVKLRKTWTLEKDQWKMEILQDHEKCRFYQRVTKIFRDWKSADLASELRKTKELSQDHEKKTLILSQDCEKYENFIKGLLKNATFCQMIEEKKTSILEKDHEKKKLRFCERVT